MSGKNKDMAPTLEQKLEEAKEATRDLADEKLKDVVGGVDIKDRLKPPSDDRPPIEAPTLNPFG